jgi:hypothetical protein
MFGTQVVNYLTNCLFRRTYTQADSRIPCHKISPIRSRLAMQRRRKGDEKPPSSIWRNRSRGRQEQSPGNWTGKRAPGRGKNALAEDLQNLPGAVKAERRADFNAERESQSLQAVPVSSGRTGEFGFPFAALWKNENRWSGVQSWGGGGKQIEYRCGQGRLRHVVPFNPRSSANHVLL